MNGITTQTSTYWLKTIRANSTPSSTLIYSPGRRGPFWDSLTGGTAFLVSFVRPNQRFRFRFLSSSFDFIFQSKFSTPLITPKEQYNLVQKNESNLNIVLYK